MHTSKAYPQLAPHLYACTLKMPLTLEGNIKTTEQRTIIQQYGDWSVHWLLMGGLLHLVQRGGAWAGCGLAQFPPHRIKYNSPPINGQCTDFILIRVAL